MRHIHPARRAVSEEEIAPRSSDEEDPKPKEVAGANLPRHRRIAQHLSWMIKTPGKNRRASSASSVYSRDDASRGCSIQERPSVAARPRGTIVRHSRIGQSEVVTSTSQDPDVRLRRSLVISGQVDMVQSEASAGYCRQQYITDQDEADADEQAAMDHDGMKYVIGPQQYKPRQPEEHDAADQVAGPQQYRTRQPAEHVESKQQLSQQLFVPEQPPTLQSKRSRRWTMLGRYTGINFATSSQSLSPSPGPTDNTENDFAAENDASKKRKSKRRLLAIMFSRMSRPSNAPAHQSATHDEDQNQSNVHQSATHDEDQNQSNAQSPSHVSTNRTSMLDGHRFGSTFLRESHNPEGPSSDLHGFPYRSDENPPSIVETPLPAPFLAPELAPHLPVVLPPRGTLDFRLNLQSGMLGLLRSQTQRTQRRIVQDTLKGMTRGTIRRPDWRLSDKKLPEKEESYHTAHSEPMPAASAVPVDSTETVDAKQGCSIRLSSGRTVWLLHPSKREPTRIAEMQKRCDDADEGEMQDAMTALAWVDHQSDGENDVLRIADGDHQCGGEHDFVKDEDEDLRPSDSSLGNDVEDERMDEHVEGEHVEDELEDLRPCDPWLRDYVEVGDEEFVPRALGFTVRKP